MRTKYIKKNKINVVTLGCSKNIYDSEILMGQLSANNINVQHESDKDDSNIIVVNTCGFIDNAKQESIDTILLYAQKKELGLIDKLFVTGCLSERYKNDLEKEISNVLKSETNELVEYLRSPIQEVSARMDQLTYQLPADNDQAGKTSPFSRKAPFHYGWDWGPCFVTSGIWRNVSLIGWNNWHVKRSSIINCGVESNLAHLLLELDIVSELNELSLIHI